MNQELELLPPQKEVTYQGEEGWKGHSQFSSPGIRCIIKIPTTSCLFVGKVTVDHMVKMAFA